MRSRRLASVIAFGVVGYLFMIPAFWSALPPDASAHIPSYAEHDGSLQIEVTVAAWHPNYKLERVRFVPDYHASEFRTEVEPPYPQAVEQNERKRRWNRVTLNRFTFPRRNTYQFEVSLEEFAEEGRLASGELRGEVEIRLSHPGSTATSSTGMGVRGEHEEVAIPFEISLY